MMNISVINRVCFLSACLTLVMLSSATSEAAFQTGADNSCIACHSKLDDARLVQPFQQWQESVHAEVGNTCDGCHGGNTQDNTQESMSVENGFLSAPKSGEIVSFCGKCHQELSKNFENGFHGAAGEPTCIDCHGTHTIRRISVDIISQEKCTQCHDYESPEKLKNILQDLHGNFQSATLKLEQVKGFPTKTLKADLKKVWEQLRHVRMVSHTFDLEQISGEAKEVKALLGHAEEDINKLVATDQKRRVWGAFTVALFLVLFVLTYFYNKEDGEDE